MRVYIRSCDFFFGRTRRAGKTAAAACFSAALDDVYLYVVCACDILYYIHYTYYINIGSREPVARRIICVRVCVTVALLPCTGNTRRTATRHTYYINPIDIRAVRRQHPAAAEPHRRPDGGRPFSVGATFSYIILCTSAHTRTPRYGPTRDFTFLFSSLSYSHSRDDDDIIYTSVSAAFYTYYICYTAAGTMRTHVYIPSGLTPDF